MKALTQRFVSTVVKPGRYFDGGGLVLHVRKRRVQVEKVWTFRHRRGGKEKWISLGPLHKVSISKAREMAACCRLALDEGRDPKLALGSGNNAAPTFGELADQLIADLSTGFKNETTARNWKRTLGDMYCARIRNRPINEITTEEIVAVLKPSWQSKVETSKKLRERIERVFDAAEVLGYREGKNPARWKGHLKLIMPTQTAKRGHHRALPWPDIPGFMKRLRALDSISALALEWTILTAVRTGDTIGARRSEIDRKKLVWKIPAERMKMSRDHRVPLPHRCIQILDYMAPFWSPEDWLFPARNPIKPLSNMAMSECLRGLGDDATVHGFRSTFSDWAHDKMQYPSEAVEAALAHVTGNAVKQAYRRGDALEFRRQLMQAWSDYCDGRDTR